MKKGGLARHYDVLTAEERFRLVLEAEAREDSAEVDRLKRTCPMKSYRMSDARYADRYEASETLVLIIGMDLTQHLAKMEVASAFAWAAPQLRDYRANQSARAFVEGVCLGAELSWRAAGRGGEPEQTDDAETAVEAGIEAAMAEAREKPDVVATVSERILVDLAAEVRAMWEAFSRFCRAELCLEPETVLGAHFAPLLGRLERQRETLDRVEPDPARVDEYADLLTRGWRRRLGL